MFESEMIAFYRKYCLAQKAGAKLKTVIPLSDRVQFIYTVLDGGEAIINYHLHNLSKETYHDHNKNIYELYEISRSPYDSKNERVIYYGYCKTCGKSFLTSNSKIKGLFVNCGECEKQLINEMLETGTTTNYMSFVYLIKNETQDIVKIGFSSNPTSRLKHLQTGNSDTLKIIGLLKGGMKLEKHLHKVFSPYKVNGEWYRDIPQIREVFDGSCKVGQ